MRRIDRHKIIDKIARHLQEQMTTREINFFLDGFSVEIDFESNQIVGSRRIYVEELLTDVDDSTVVRIASELGIEVPGSPTLTSQNLKSFLDANALHSCHEDFNRCLLSADADPAQAMASASSTLESICKAILDSFQLGYPKDQSLQPLLRAVFSAMNLSPETQAEAEIKRILGGLLSAAIGIGVLRTKYSAAHGRGDKQKRLTHRHARLAINATSTIGLFLLETYQERFAVKVKAS